jgi:hypothetical protein
LSVTLSLGGVLSAAPQSKNARVAHVYRHELPNVPGERIKVVRVEYGPGGSPKRSNCTSSAPGAPDRSYRAKIHRAKPQRYQRR